MENINKWLIYIFLLFIGFIIICQQPTKEHFNWRNGTPNEDRTWCTYFKKRLTGFQHTVDLLKTDPTLYPICKPDTMDKCVNEVHNKYPFISTIQLIRNTNPKKFKYNDNTRSEKGTRCKNWTDKQIKEYPNKGLGRHSECRNPDEKEYDWCNTDNGEERCNPMHPSYSVIFQRNSDDKSYLTASEHSDVYVKKCLNSTDTCNSSGNRNTIYQNPKCSGPQ